MDEELTDALAPRLRDGLLAAGFTYDAAVEALGAQAHQALSRNETVPGLRTTTGGSPVETLTRLWLLQADVPEAAVEQALPGLVDGLVGAGILERHAGQVRALLDVRPYATDAADLWVVSDLTPGLDGRPARVAADHVLGISPAATSLAQITVRDEVGSALDLGTGCGVQSLHLAAHAGQVVATDVNRRALELTRFNLVLNDVSGVDVREGSLFEPVAGERFDLVATNPPFVISPALRDGPGGPSSGTRDGPGGPSSGTREGRLLYRDSGLPGDLVVERIVREVPGHLRPGGVAQVLANWVIARDRPWDERLADWISGCDAWAVQREVLDPPAYVELWLKDAGLHPSTGGTVEDYRRRYNAWLAWFDEQGVEAVGFGWISLRATGAEPVLRLEEWPYEIEQPLGEEVAAYFSRSDALRRLSDDDLLAGKLVARPDLRQETYGAPGAADPEQVVLRQQRWMRRARQADTVEAALVGACDGELTLAQILDALGRLLETTSDLRAAYLPVVRELVAEGFLAAPR
ncbi:MAG: methyltransferase [Marmoricola sp.]|nr:methyltransferase [Marmoricola sp.]